MAVTGSCHIPRAPHRQPQLRAWDAPPPWEEALTKFQRYQGHKRHFKAEENKSERQKYKEKSPTQIPQVQKVLQEPGTTVHDPFIFPQPGIILDPVFAFPQPGIILDPPSMELHSFSFIPFTAFLPSLCLPPLEVPGYGSNCSVKLQYVIFPGF